MAWNSEWLEIRQGDPSFEPLVTLLATVNGQYHALNVHQLGMSSRGGRWDRAILDGIGRVLVFRPWPLMELLVRNQMPEELILEFEDPEIIAAAGISRAADMDYFVTVTRPHMHTASQAMFLAYYETEKPATTLLTWPAEWQFAWAVRNACAHRGVIEWRDLRVNEVEWRSIKITPAAHGRPLHEIITVVELMLLAIDLDGLAGVPRRVVGPDRLAEIIDVQLPPIEVQDPTLVRLDEPVTVELRPGELATGTVIAIDSPLSMVKVRLTEVDGEPRHAVVLVRADRIRAVRDDGRP